MDERLKNREVDYDSIAEGYDRRYQHEDDFKVAAFLLDFVGGAGSALEVGCGTGHWLELLSSRVPLAAGIDPAIGMLRRARLRLPTTSLIRAQAEALPFQAQTFDRLFSINAFHHFSDKVAFLSEAGRILGPNGALLTVGLDPHTGLDSWWIYDYFQQTFEIDKRRYPPAAEIRRSMERAGFRNCATQELEHVSTEVAAGAAEQSGMLDPASTSQLTVLTNVEYEQGVERLRKKMEAAQKRGEELLLNVDLRLYATVGWI